LITSHVDLLIGNFTAMLSRFIIPMVNAARIQKYFTRFESAGALDSGNARSLQSLGLDKTNLFFRMLRNQVFVESTPGSYYVVPENYLKFKSLQKKKLLLITAGVLLALVFTINYLK